MIGLIFEFDRLIFKYEIIEIQVMKKIVFKKNIKKYLKTIKNQLQFKGYREYSWTWELIIYL